MKKLSEMPEDFFIINLNVEADRPYLFAAETAISEEIKFEVPEALAYYLRTHWGGTDTMRKNREESHRRKFQNEVKELLGIKEK